MFVTTHYIIYYISYKLYICIYIWHTTIFWSSIHIRTTKHTHLIQLVHGPHPMAELPDVRDQEHMNNYINTHPTCLMSLTMYHMKLSCT